jgi:hypothetical protein
MNTAAPAYRNVLMIIDEGWNAIAERLKNKDPEKRSPFLIHFAESSFIKVRPGATIEGEGRRGGKGKPIKLRAWPSR